MKNNIFTLTLVYTLFLALLGCGKDRDLQDYKNDLLAKSLSKIQAIQGSYAGYVISKKDGSNMGAMKVSLAAKTKVISGSDQSGSTAQPILAVNIDFHGVSKMAVVTQDSYFDSEKGQFQTDIPIKIKNSQGEFENKTVSINGVVVDGRLIGELQVTDYPEYGANLNLAKQQDVNLEALAKKNPPAAGGFTNSGYIGTTHFARGATKNVLMIVSKPNTTSEADFYNLFSPVKPVQITLKYGQEAQINFVNGNWDQRVGKLTGQAKLSQVLVGPNGTSTTQTVDIPLTCELANGTGFACKIQAGNAVGTIATLNLVPNIDGSEVPEDNANRSTITKSYQGIWKLSPTENIPSTLAVTYPARTHMEEITNLFFHRTEMNVLVHLSFGPSVNFLNVKWDTVNGTLDTTQTVQTGGMNVVLTLMCQNFHFTDAEKGYSFQCHYHSSMGNSDEQFIFTSEP